MSTVATKLMTAEEFWVSPENGKHRELVAGEVVERMPTGGVHAAVARRVIEQLGAWAREGDRGEVGPESGFILARDPDIVRAPDVFFVSKSRFSKGGIPEAFWPLAPDLAVEVISPGETAVEINEKAHEYLSAGTALVWLIYPRSREVVVQTPDGHSHRFRENDVLQDENVLPGFRCAVAELFR
ncbi:MAG: Uma2 family endonuclease [Planctomycetales bacterium]|nr:Uma2 family endonuclease [Planctomycetales bacterium]